MSTEEELESFRRRWQEEVSRRDTSGLPSSRDFHPILSASGSGRPFVRNPPPAEKAPRVEADVEGEGRTYHDLEDKESYLSLDHADERSKGFAPKEPKSALEHYEKAVQRESEGVLGDSVGLYRRAFKLDAGVQEAYKKKHFPQTSKPNNANPSNVSATVPNTARHSLEGSTPVPTIPELIEEFSQLQILPTPPETDLSPRHPCPIAELPEEIVSAILAHVGRDDVAVLSRLARTCKRISYLVMTEDSIWKDIWLRSKYGIRSMHYKYASNILGHRLQLMDMPPAAPHRLDLTPSEHSSYRLQLRNRPRIRFGGCYISTVNYTRQGGASQSRSTWNNPVHTVTYFRYLRFFRDGTCISLQTTTEPVDTVHHLTKENIHKHHTGAMPQPVMREALQGRWRLSGVERIPWYESDEFEEPKGPGEYDVEPADSHEVEEEGTIHVETEGVKPKYMWKMHFDLGSSGRKNGTRNNKLSWKGFWSYNRLSDDWGEFALKNDRPFYWSRVKSYAL